MRSGNGKEMESINALLQLVWPLFLHSPQLTILGIISIIVDEIKD